MFPQLDLAGVKTQSVDKRSNKVSLDDSAHPIGAENASFEEFVASLPSILKAKELEEFTADIVSSRKRNLPVILMMGAHVIKTGLSPIVIDLMQQGIVTAVGMNSAGAIHDSESALFGVTSEDVAANLKDGSFGMWRETGDFINGNLKRAAAHDQVGFGETLGRALIDEKPPYLDYSIMAAAVLNNIPVSIHAAIGTDIVHQQPGMDGAVTGEMSYRDFRVLCHSVKDLQGGGAVINAGSAVILPEVFLKVLTVVRNLGHAAEGFSTANFDMIQHYRPHMNVVSRPTQGDGRGYSFTGHHEIMLPLLAALVKLRMATV